MILATACIDFPQAITDVVRQNREYWADQLGLKLQFWTEGVLDNSWHLAWNKIPCMIDALERDSEILWVDADALIVSHPDLLELMAPMSVAKDANGWNLGVWYVQETATPILKFMLNQSQYKNASMYEQSLFWDLDKWGLLHDVTELDGSKWNSPDGEYIKHFAGQYHTRFDSILKLAKEIA